MFKTFTCAAMLCISDAASAMSAGPKKVKVTEWNRSVGARVQRGPNWKWGNQDHVHNKIRGQGTIRKFISRGVVEVKWDNGLRGDYRAGEENAYDLVFVGNVAKIPRQAEEESKMPDTGESRKCREVYADDINEKSNKPYCPHFRKLIPDQVCWECHAEECCLASDHKVRPLNHPGDDLSLSGGDRAKTKLNKRQEKQLIKKSHMTNARLAEIDRASPRVAPPERQDDLERPCPQPRMQWDREQWDREIFGRSSKEEEPHDFKAPIPLTPAEVAARKQSGRKPAPMSLLKRRSGPPPSDKC